MLPRRIRARSVSGIAAIPTYRPQCRHHGVVVGHWRGPGCRHRCNGEVGVAPESWVGLTSVRATALRPRAARQSRGSDQSVATGARSRFQSCIRSWAFGSGTARPPPQSSSFSCTGGVWSGSVRSCGGPPTASQLGGPPPRQDTRPPVAAGAVARSHTPLAEDAGFEPARSQQRNLAFPR
jgi:hypothetical protein